MPNWVKNEVVISGDISAVKDAILKDGKFSFENFIPMPQSLRIEEGTCVLNGIALLRGTEEEKEHIKERNSAEEIKKFLDLGKIALENEEKYGARTWYYWSINNWGTKWDVDVDNVRVEETDNAIYLYFETAWSTPFPFFEKLSKEFAEVEIYVRFADEDLGSNCGEYTLVGGEITEDLEGDFEFACDMWGYDAEELEAEWKAEWEDIDC